MFILVNDEPAPAGTMETPLQQRDLEPSWLADSRGFVLDLDGTLICGRRPTDGARALLDRLHGRFMLVSNNSTHGAEELADELARMDLPVPAHDVVLAGEQTVRIVAREHPGCRVMALASSSIRRLAKDAGLRLVGRYPDVVILARDCSFSYAKLLKAANAVRAGARLAVTNPDLTHPGPESSCVPETGSLLQALLACTGIHPDLIVGKPGPLLFEEALRRLGTAAHQTVVIGDNPATDAAGAVAAGMRYVLIGDDSESDAGSPAELLRYNGAARNGRDQNRLIDSTSKVRRMVSTASS